uniref:Ubiquitin-like protease family profile domain-containing protein n=1 Tax=Aegilops tauschii TaxID=37682 RepID=M8BGW2_AEGTA
MTDEELFAKHAHMKLVRSPTRLAKVMKLLSRKHIEKIISKIGLGGLTKLHEFKLRHIMLIRLAKSFDSETSSITIGKTPIRITPEDVHHIFGLAIEGEDIDEKLQSTPDPNLFNTFQHNGTISLADLETTILSSKTPDDDFLARVEMIVATLNARCAEQEKKIGRDLMEFQHIFDAKFLTLSEELIDLKSKSGSNPRLSLLEDEIKDLRRELKFDASTPYTSTPTPSVRHVLRNKEDPRVTPLKPLFDNDYVLTAEDKEAAVFIRGTRDPVEVVQIGDIPLRAKQLKPIYNKKYICGDVIMAYAHISGVETDTTSVISPDETRKPLETKGVIPKGRGSSWIQRDANKFVGHRKVHIPVNVHNHHWMAMVFNFDKEEIQILNSLKDHFDKSKETALVESIQACMDEAVKDGLVTPGKPIKFTDLEVVRYDDIPQQDDGSKIVSSLLRVDCNGLRIDSYKYPITKEMYAAHVAAQPMDSQDDVQEIIGTVECKKTDTSSSQKDPDTPRSPKKWRSRGGPRKVVDEVQATKTKTLEERKVEFDSKTIAKQVSSMSRRPRKPSQVILSPFKTTKW